MASKSDSDALVLCPCRYCKGKKVSRYVRRQHNERYQCHVPTPPPAVTSFLLQGANDKAQDEVLNAEDHRFDISVESPSTQNDEPSAGGPVTDVSLDLSHSDDEDYDETLGDHGNESHFINDSTSEELELPTDFESNSCIDDCTEWTELYKESTEEQGSSCLVQNSYQYSNPDAHLPLYSGANTTLLETLAKHFEWFTSHPGTSKEALSEVLCLEHNILPEGNILPDSYSSAFRLIEPYLIKQEVFHACTNDCILFRNEYVNATECPKCGSPRYKHKANSIPFRKFIYLPLQPRLARMFGSRNIAEIIQSHIGSSQTNSPFMYDIHDSPTWREAYSPDGLFNGDKRGISLAFCTDGVNPFSHNRVSYSMWPIMLTLLNLPRIIRNSFSSIILLGIVPGNGTQEPKSLDPYLDVAVDELLRLSNVDLFDAYKAEPFKLKVEILLYVLDYPGIGKVFRMSGSGAYKGCVWCEVKGTFCSDLHKMVYLQNRRYLPAESCLRQQKRGFPVQEAELLEPPAKRDYNLVRDHQHAFDYASKRSNSNASWVTKTTGCKGVFCLMKLPNFNPILQSVPDAMHTVKDALVNLHELMTGKDDTMNCRQCEVSHGARFGLTAASLQRKINRKNPGVPYSLSTAEIKIADSRAVTIITPVHVGYVPGNIFSRTSNLKSHDWKQICSQGILKYCLRGFLGQQQRKAVFMFIDVCRQLFAEIQNTNELPLQSEKTNLALAQLERDMPITIQVITLHLIRHVMEGIQRFGPVYATWMYPYERFNSWMSQRALNRNHPEATVMETYRIYEWCCYMKLSKQVSSDKEWIVTPAADKIISLTDHQQKWLHTYYLKKIPEYQSITQEYMADKAKSVTLRKRSLFPSKDKWSPPLRKISEIDRQLLIGPPSSAFLLRKVQLHLSKTGRWITYSSSQFQQSTRISSAYVCVSNEHSKAPQFGRISMIFSHKFGNYTGIFAMVTLYGDATFDQDVAMWFTPPITETVVMLPIEDLSEPLVVAHDDGNMVTWFLNYFQ